MISNADARAILRAVPAVADFSDDALDFVQAVALFETGYGQGWAHAPGCACVDSHNWGSVHARPGQPSCPCTDSTAAGVRYPQAMRVYADDQEGAADLVAQLRAHRVAWEVIQSTTDPADVAYAMRLGPYPYYEAPLDTYTIGLTRAWRSVRASRVVTRPIAPLVVLGAIGVAGVVAEVLALRSRRSSSRRAAA